MFGKQEIEKYFLAEKKLGCGSLLYWQLFFIFSLTANLYFGISKLSDFVIAGESPQTYISKYRLPHISNPTPGTFRGN